MIEETFTLYEQTIADTEQQFLVELEYTQKEPGKVSDFHGLNLALRRPGDKFSFAEILIEYRGGLPRILVWHGENGFDDDPVVLEMNPDAIKYCLNCGCDWSVHNDDGSCPEED